MVGNGDVHRLYQLGSCYSLVDAERHPDSICAAIRAGRVQVDARPLTTFQAGRVVCDLFGSDLRAWWQNYPASGDVTDGRQTRPA